jgi:hypothetical protein
LRSAESRFETVGPRQINPLTVFVDKGAGSGSTLAAVLVGEREHAKRPRLAIYI